MLSCWDDKICIWGLAFSAQTSCEYCNNKKSYTLLQQVVNDCFNHNILLKFFSAFKKISCRESRACEVSGFRHRSDNMESTWDLGLWGSLDEAAGSWSCREGDGRALDVPSWAKSPTLGPPRSPCWRTGIYRPRPTWKKSWVLRKTLDWPSVSQDGARQLQCSIPWEYKVRLMDPCLKKLERTWWKPGLPTLLSGFSFRKSVAASLYLQVMNQQEQFSAVWSISCILPFIQISCNPNYCISWKHFELVVEFPHIHPEIKWSC